MKIKYTLLDAFTRIPFNGAQIAVFTHADNLSQQQKLKLTKELNLTETVFQSRSVKLGCDAKLEIFSAQGECSFAGHAVVAACYAMGESGLLQGSDARVELDGRQFDIVLGIKNRKVQISIPISEKYDEYVPSNKELAQIMGIDQSELFYQEYKPMIVGCPEPYLMVPVKSNDTLRNAEFHENKWQLSFVASLARHILLFTGEHPYEEVNFTARIMGKGVAQHEDPPIGSAAPAFGLYLAYKKDDFHRSCFVQRGSEDSRISVLEVNVDKKGSDVKSIQLGGYAIKMAEGYFDVPELS